MLLLLLVILAKMILEKSVDTLQTLAMTFGVARGGVCHEIRELWGAVTDVECPLQHLVILANV